MPNSMRNENARLDTFRNWPQSIGVSPLQLASSGFYYNGSDDQVTCFSCRGRIMAWQSGDVPMEEHRRHFPQCTFLSNPVQAGNIVYTFDETDSDSAVKSNSEQTQCDHAANGGTPLTSVGHHGHGNISASSNSLPHTGRNHQSANCPTHTSSISQVNGDMKQEHNRLQTLNSWPKRNIISIQEVAKAGLYFTGEEDKLKCAFCGGQMVNWERGDSPAEEHRKHFGAKCPLLQKPAPSNSLSNQLNSLNIVTDKPQHKQYSSEESRMESFRSWQFSHVQQPKKLAKAGFFCTGDDDSVRCFFCGVGLRNWEAVDEPLEEHRKWASKCGFLRYRETTSNGHVSDEEMAEDTDLEEQNRRLKEERICKSCRTRESNMVFLPCGHIVTCEQCAPPVKTCLKCHTTIKGTVKAFMT